jgi:hypothetical protein
VNVAGWHDRSRERFLPGLAVRPTAAVGALDGGQGPGRPNGIELSPDGKTLYITSGTPSDGGDSGNFAFYSVQLTVPGWLY